MSAPNVELLDYNWGYRKLAVAEVEIVKLNAKVAEQAELYKNSISERVILQREVEEQKDDLARQEAVVAQLRAKIELAFSVKMHGFEACQIFDDEYEDHCQYCGYDEAHVVHALVALGKQENDSAK